jgi:hypothetical protein
VRIDTVPDPTIQGADRCHHPDHLHRAVRLRPAPLRVVRPVHRGGRHPRPRNHGHRRVRRVGGAADQAGRPLVIPFNVSCGHCWTCSHDAVPVRDDPRCTRTAPVPRCSATGSSTARWPVARPSCCGCPGHTTGRSRSPTVRRTSGFCTSPTCDRPHGRRSSTDHDDLAAELREHTGGRGPDSVIDAVGMEGHSSGGVKAAQAFVGLLPDAKSLVSRYKPTSRQAPSERMVSTSEGGAGDTRRLSTTPCSGLDSEGHEALGSDPMRPRRRRYCPMEPGGTLRWTAVPTARCSQRPSVRKCGPRRRRGIQRCRSAGRLRRRIGTRRSLRAEAGTHEVAWCRCRRRPGSLPQGTDPR